MNYTDKTLGELLSSTNETIRRNAISILKEMQKTSLYRYGNSHVGIAEARRENDKIALQSLSNK